MHFFVHKSFEEWSLQFVFRLLNIFWLLIDGDVYFWILIMNFFSQMEDFIDAKFSCLGDWQLMTFTSFSIKCTSSRLWIKMNKFACVFLFLIHEVRLLDPFLPWIYPTIPSVERILLGCQLILNFIWFCRLITLVFKMEFENEYQQQIPQSKYECLLFGN